MKEIQIKQLYPPGFVSPELIDHMLYKKRKENSKSVIQKNIPSMYHRRQLTEHKDNQQKSAMSLY